MINGPVSKSSSLIINADDFGHDSNVNSAILQCFKKGMISSTTLMANMPGFSEACEIAHAHKLLDHIGLHIVLTEGSPLTTRIKEQRRFCDQNGDFLKTRNRRLFHLTTIEKQCVKEEIKAQIERCRLNGLHLTHVDSHHHIHEETGILILIISLMREFNIPYIRIMGNTADSCSLHRFLYSIFYNRYLQYLGLNRTRYFGSFDQYLSKYTELGGGAFEIMTHPKFDADGVIVDLLNKKSIELILNEADFLSRNMQSYSGHTYATSTSNGVAK